MLDIIRTHKNQFLVYLFLGLSLLLFSILVQRDQSEFLARFFGSLPPPLALIIVILVGALCFGWVITTGRFYFYQPGQPVSKLGWILVSIPLALVMIYLDYRFIRFPETINATFPTSLLVYPVMGFTAQILLHILPFVMIYTLARGKIQGLGDNTLVWMVIILVAVVEAIFQASPLAGHVLPWAAGTVFAHLLVFGGLELYLFTRFDFLTMFGFRIVYYLFWHILWGHFRLDILY